MKKAAIIITFLSLAGYGIYAILVFTQALTAFDVYLNIQTFGLVWCFCAVIFAFIALWFEKIGSILIILSGVLFFASVWATNHYIGIYLPVSGVYTIGGILHSINAFFIKKRMSSD